MRAGMLACRGEEGAQFDGAGVAAVASEEAEGECSRRALVSHAC